MVARIETKKRGQILAQKSESVLEQARSNFFVSKDDPLFFVEFRNPTGKFGLTLDLEDFELLFARGEVNGHGFTHLVAKESLAERRVNREFAG